jgi:hypothetical protein
MNHGYTPSLQAGIQPVRQCMRSMLLTSEQFLSA